MSGTTRAQLAKYLAEMSADPADPRHGTHTGYVYGCRCDACIAAGRAYTKKHNETVRELKQARRKRLKAANPLYGIETSERMDMNAYQKRAMRTCSLTGDRDEMRRHAVFGLASEAGEVAALMQKEYQGHPFDKRRFKRELGDCLWMVAEAALSVDASLAEIAEINIEKLRDRYPDGFEPERSVNRREGDD